MDFRAGEVILINKPLKWTSFQVVNKMKYLIKDYYKHTNIPLQQHNSSNPPSLSHSQSHKGDNTSIIQPARPAGGHPSSNIKIGHAGTLDPLATGLLIVCTGKETKNIDKYQAQEKEYTGTFYIGATTPCFDLEKEIDAHYPTEHITNEMIYEVTKKFIGKIQQTPPLFSAIKIDGKRAYDIARAGKTAEIKPKEIEIKQFEITRIALPEVDFKVICSKGTYIRSLARDFGIALNSGAHLIALCRTRIGEYVLEKALKIEEFEQKIKK